MKYHAILFVFTLLALSLSRAALAQEAAHSASSLLDIEKMITGPTHRNGALSPDGQYFSYVRWANGTTYIDLVNLATGGKRHILKSNKKYPVKNYAWLNDNTMLLYTAESNTAKSRQYIYTFELEPDEGLEYSNGKFVRLANGYVVDTLDDSPKHILYAYINKTEKGLKSGLYRISIQNLKKSSFNNNTIIDEASDDLVRYIYDAKYNRILGMFFNADSMQVDMRYREYEGTQWKNIMTFKDAKYSLYPIGFINDEKVGVLTNKNTDKIVLQVFDIASQSLGDILYEHPTYDLTDAWLGAQGNALAVEYFQGGSPHKEWLSSSELNLDDEIKAYFAPHISFVLDVDKQNNKALVFSSSDTHAGQYHLYDTSNKSSQNLVSMYPDFEAYNFAKTDVFKVAVEDDVEVEAYLTKAPTSSHNTLLVMPHGGPIGVREDNLFRPDVQVLANRGFTVLRINFRGSSGFGKAFQDQGVGQFGQQIESDISSVVDHVLATYNYQSVCAMGSSYGAYSSIMLAIKHPELYKCVVAAFGIYDLPLLFNASNYRSGDDFGEYIAEVVGENSRDKLAVSPVYHAEKVMAPVLLIAGKQDLIAGFEQSNRMRYMLERAEKDIEYFFYENTGHGHSNYYLDQHELSLSLDFLYRQLDIARPSPSTLHEDDIAILANEFASISDGYTNTNITAEDTEKNYEYLLKAAEYNNARAHFNLGAYYSRAHDYAKARPYYEKAAELGFEKAHERLGMSYMRASLGLSETVQADDEKALYHLNKALEFADTEINRKRLARLHCTAAAPIKNVEKCLEDLLDSLEDPNFYDGMRDNFAMAVIDGTHNVAEKEQMLAFAKKWFEPTLISFELEPAEVGVYVYESAERYGRIGEYELSAQQNLALLTEKMGDSNVALGVRFLPDSAGFPSKKDRVIAVVEWLEHNKDNILTRRDFVSIKRSPTGKWHRYFAVNDYTLGTTYTLNIYSIDGTLTYAKRFVPQ